MSKKQDRAFVRTAAQLKRELSAGRKFKEAFSQIGDTRVQVDRLEDELPEDLREFKHGVLEDVRSITDETIKTAAEAKTIAELVVSGENVRIEAEAKRTENENARISAENDRVTVTEKMINALDNLLTLQERYINGGDAI